MDSLYGFTSVISERTMERYEEMGNNSIHNAMSTTATNIAESCTMQEDKNLQNSLQIKVGSIDPYSDSKSMSQLRKRKVNRHNGSTQVLGAHLQLKDPEVYHAISLFNDTDKSSVVTTNDGNRFYFNHLSINPIHPKELCYDNSSSKLKTRE